MRKEMVLVTGASGEMGQALIQKLAQQGCDNILAVDLAPVPPEVRQHVRVALAGDILDGSLLARLVSEFAIPEIYHLAALLSTRAEFTPEAAHHVNVDGTLGLLRLAAEQSSWLGAPVRFIFPSSVAVYGIESLGAKERAGRVREEEYNFPTTMYGCNKLYCEQLGRYYARYYRQLAATPGSYAVDFRSLRFPGLISAFTLPTGGTSDYAPEMLHHAAQGEPYRCFVRPDTRIPFMAMPDAIKALTCLAAAPQSALGTHVYNVTSFAPTAEELWAEVQHAFPAAQVSFEPDLKRQAIVDTWPCDQDDSRARRDWGWAPDYDRRRAFDDYLVPNIRRRYAAR